MQQRQLRLGDILDDYCPRERRLTNHAVVAMVGDEVRQTRCTTCEAEHEYKHARVPRPRRKSEPAALYAQVLADVAPKKVVHEAPVISASDRADRDEVPEQGEPAPGPLSLTAEFLPGSEDEAEQSWPQSGDRVEGVEEGPVHRPLIRAQLPRIDGTPPAQRQAPDFTIRQPAGRQNRFRPRHQRGGPQGVQGGRSGGNFLGSGNVRGGAPRQYGSRPQQPARAAKHGSGRKRSK